MYERSGRGAGRASIGPLAGAPPQFSVVEGLGRRSTVERKIRYSFLDHDGVVAAFAVARLAPVEREANRGRVRGTDIDVDVFEANRR